MWPFKEKRKPVFCSDCEHRSEEKVNTVGGELKFMCKHPQNLNKWTDFVEGNSYTSQSSCSLHNGRGLCKLWKKSENSSK